MSKNHSFSNPFWNVQKPKEDRSMIEATIICDSISEQGKRLTTYKLRYPRFIHAEFMTHRMISRNASGSRAVPVRKMIEEARSDKLRASPVFWGREQKGMQAGEELSDDNNVGTAVQISSRRSAQYKWESAAWNACASAEEMIKLGVHKSIVNRILEPFVHINVVATATEWDNFFGLRLHKDAQAEIRTLAVQMWAARQASTPKLLKPGEWHLPFINAEDITTFVLGLELYKLIKVSVARCARVSYESFETQKPSTVEEDLKLYEKLVGAQPLHASPAEHQATPDRWINPRAMAPEWANIRLHGNLVGWQQYRKMLPDEAVAPLPEGYE